MSVHEEVNILMVDDQPGKLLSYEAILADLGENLIKATSAKEALEKLLKTDVAVVLMDVSMPEIDGFELAEIIRQHPRFQKTAIIFVSAVHLTDLDRLKGYQHGAVDYLSVPIVPEVLRAKVRVFAELHRKKLQLERLNNELEQRVADRTLELEHKAVALQRLNSDLAQKNQELDAIVHTAPDIIFSRQADGTRDYISSRFYEYTGAAEGSAVGFGWLEYLHPDDKERSLAEWMRCVQSGEAYESEYRIRGVDQQYRWFRARAVPLRDPEGNILKWYGTCSDIHDSKMLEQSIRDSAIELERMVDLRTSELRRLSGRSDDVARRRAPPHRSRNSRRPGTRVSCGQDDRGRHSCQGFVAFHEAGLLGRESVSGSSYPASPNDFASSAPSAAGRSRARFGASLVSGGINRTQRNRSSTGSGSSRSKPAEAGTGNGNLPHNPGGLDQHVPAFRSAQRIDRRGGK